MKQIVTILGAGAVALSVSCKPKGTEAAAEGGSSSLVITAIPDEKVSDQAENYKPLVKYLSDELGVPVTFSESSDYAAAVERFKNGEIHMAWFGGLTGVQAMESVEGARAIAQGSVDPNFKSYFIAHHTSGLQKSDDFPVEISDMTFTFGSPGSTSGRLMPTYFIEQETGKTPEEFFTQPVQFQSEGGHYATAKAVESGSVQVGAINYKTYDTMVAEGDLDASKAQIIWVTPDYADYNLTVHPDLDDQFGEGFIDKLQTALVECEDKDALRAFNRDDLIPAKNEDFAGIKAVAEKVGLMR
ncbi:MAG: putative selenate ABC transporter substrate-binding protein [Verrucomicrobiota bacterium JB023]|nr:putative selenate ABC transporter substrate-binding protein [Verrucomicrobiota bacterium JB023]